MQTVPKNISDELKGVPANPLDTEEKAKDDVVKIYEDKDREYLSFVESRLTRAWEVDQMPHPEFNNRTRQQYYEDNEKIANTILEPKKNDDDVIVSGGTVEQKLEAVLSHVNNLNLAPEVHAFDTDNNEITALSQALEDIIEETEEQERSDMSGDEEPKMMRQLEMMKQGTVFVQEEWLKLYETKKVLKQKFNGEFENFAGYSEKLVKVFDGPSRRLLYGLNVLLGDPTQFYMDNQPFVGVVIRMSYESAKAQYGKFENFKYVRPGKIPENVVKEQRTMFNNSWRMTSVKDNQVEVILYQDQSKDEFQIIINGVMMLPIGFPLSAVTPGGKYNITKQVYRIINSHFAFGKSFVQSGSVFYLSAVLDEMMRLFILKTRKSFTPAYLNTSGRVISTKVLTPGRISMNLFPGQLEPISGGETQGVTAGEAAMYDRFERKLDENTVSKNFLGQQAGRQITATEANTIEKNAKLTLGLTITVCSILEKKLAFLRLYNILDKWFEPVSTRVVGVEGAREYIRSFRKTNREKNIEGEGVGRRKVLPIDGELPNTNTIRMMEREEQNITGKPVRMIFLNPDELRKAKLIWKITITPKEKDTTAMAKASLREMINDAMLMVNFGSVINKDGIEEEFARVWKKNRSQLFQPASPTPTVPGMENEDGRPVQLPDTTTGLAGALNSGGDSVGGEV